MGVSEPAALGFTPNDLLLVEGNGVRMKGRFVEATDAVIRLRVDAYPSEREVQWSAIRRISRRAGRERKWWIPTMLALVIGVLLGAVGWFFDEVNRSSSGDPYRPGQLLLPLAGIGALIGALLGTLIAFTLQGPWWDPLYAVPDDAIIASDGTWEARLAAGAVTDEARQALLNRSYNSSFVAWVVLGVLVLGVWGWCTQNFR